MRNWGIIFFSHRRSSEAYFSFKMEDTMLTIYGEDWGWGAAWFEKDGLRLDTLRSTGLAIPTVTGTHRGHGFPLFIFSARPARQKSSTHTMK